MQNMQTYLKSSKFILKVELNVFKKRKRKIIMYEIVIVSSVMDYFIEFYDLINLESASFAAALLAFSLLLPKP